MAEQGLGKLDQKQIAFGVIRERVGYCLDHLGPFVNELSRCSRVEPELAVGVLAVSETLGGYLGRTHVYAVLR